MYTYFNTERVALRDIQLRYHKRLRFLNAISRP